MKLHLPDLKTYWINLDNRQDRQENMAKLFVELGMNNTERVSAIEAQPYFYGCGMSHIKTLKKGLEHGLPFLVLEDDVAYTDGFKKEILIPDGVDALYLGGTSWPAEQSRAQASRLSHPMVLESYTEDLAKVAYMTSLHAVVYIGEEYVKRCIDGMYDWVENRKWHCDVATAEIQKDFNVTIPSGELWFYQNDPRNIPWTKLSINRG